MAHKFVLPTLLAVGAVGDEAKIADSTARTADLDWLIPLETGPSNYTGPVHQLPDYEFVEERSNTDPYHGEHGVFVPLKQMDHNGTVESFFLDGYEFLGVPEGDYDSHGETNEGLEALEAKSADLDWLMSLETGPSNYTGPGQQLPDYEFVEASSTTTPDAIWITLREGPSNYTGPVGHLPDNEFVEARSDTDPLESEHGGFIQLKGPSNYRGPVEKLPDYEFVEERSNTDPYYGEHGVVVPQKQMDHNGTVETYLLDGFEFLGVPEAGNVSSQEQVP